MDKKFLDKIEQVEKKASKCFRAMTKAEQARQELLQAREELTEYKNKLMTQHLESIK